MISVRTATADDCALLWRWANEPAVRAAAFNSQAIPWDDHVEWFNERLASPDAVIYIAVDDGMPVGQVRFDIDPAGGVQVDVSVAKEHRGRGLGAAALRSAVRAFAARRSAPIAARIRPENEASLRAFSSAGFVRAGVVRVGDAEAILMTLPAEQAGA